MSHPISITIDVPAGDDWETVWDGDWPYLPPAGSIMEIRFEPGGPVRYLRVVNTRAVLWADTLQPTGWGFDLGGGLARTSSGRAASFVGTVVYAIPIPDDAAAPTWPPSPCPDPGHSASGADSGRIHTPVMGCAGCAAEMTAVT